MNAAPAKRGAGDDDIAISTRSGAPARRAGGSLISSSCPSRTDKDSLAASKSESPKEKATTEGAAIELGCGFVEEFSPSEQPQSAPSVTMSSTSIPDSSSLPPSCGTGELERCKTRGESGDRGRDRGVASFPVYKEHGERRFALNGPPLWTHRDLAMRRRTTRTHRDRATQRHTTRASARQPFPKAGPAARRHAIRSGRCPTALTRGS